MPDLNSRSFCNEWAEILKFMKTSSFSVDWVLAQIRSCITNLKGSLRTCAALLSEVDGDHGRSIGADRRRDSTLAELRMFEDELA